MTALRVGVLAPSSSADSEAHHWVFMTPTQNSEVPLYYSETRLEISQPFQVLLPATAPVSSPIPPSLLFSLPCPSQVLQGEMLAPARFLMLLLLLLPSGTPSPDPPTKFYKVKSISSCINAALSGSKGDQLEGPLPQSKRNFFMEKEIQEGQKGKREVEKGKWSPLGVARYKAPSPQLRGKLPQDKAKSNRRAQFTLSLDVPTNIMNVLFDIAKAKNVRAKAAANAQLLAQVGRRK